MTKVAEIHNETNKAIIKKVGEVLTQIYNSGLSYDELLDCAIKNFQALSATEYELEQVLDIDFGDFIATFRKRKDGKTDGIVCKNREVIICGDVEVFLRVSDEPNAELFQHYMKPVHKTENYVTRIEVV
jgi:hypothetical protein